MSPGVVFNSYSHTIDDIENTLKAYNEVCQKIKKVVQNDEYEKHIQGNLPTTVWTMKISPTKKRI